MSDYCILRIQKHGANMGTAAKMIRHALREDEVKNADPDKRDQNTIKGPTTSAGVLAAVRAKLPKNRRRDAVPVIEFFVSASPEAMHSMSREAQDKYFKDAVTWIGERFGGDNNIVSYAVHRDESTPHLQLFLVPLEDGKLRAKAMVGGKADMVAMQTHFWEKVGRGHGLRRGEPATETRAKHTTIAQFYRAVNEAGSVDALPPAMRVPPALPEPGRLATAAEKAAYSKREREREEARKANQRRQKEIERLAMVGLAVKGKAARTDLPAVLAKVEKAAEALAEQRQTFNDRYAELKALDDAVATARAELEQLEARAKATRRELSPPDTQKHTDPLIVDPGALRRGQRSR